MKDDLTKRVGLGRPLYHRECDANENRLMYWSGKWVPGTFQQYQVVEHLGELWSCAAVTTTEEPWLTSVDWDRVGNNTREIWEATPITGMTAQTIQWTFVPQFTGQTPLLLSESAGTFTFLTNAARVDFQLQPFCTYQVAANNSDCQYTIIPTYTGAGIDTILGIRGSMGSPRAASFPTSGFSLGTVIAAAGDTIVFTADSSGTNGSNVDLDEMFLQVSGPIP